MCSSCLQNAKDLFPLAKTEEKGPTCHISENWRLAEGSHRRALANKKCAKLLATARWCPGPARRWVTVAPGWCLAGAWLALGWWSIPPGVGFVLPSAFCWHFLSSPCYSESFISLDFWNKSFHLQKGHKKWGLVVYLDQCNPKCIYLQK